MSPVKQPIRGLSPSTPKSLPFEITSLFQGRKNSTAGIRVTPTTSKHRGAVCARRILNSSIPLQVTKQSNRASSAVSILITPSSPESQVCYNPEDTSDELDSTNHLRDSERSDFLKPKKYGSPENIPFSPSTLDSILSPGTNRRGLQNCEKLASPLYTPERKDVFLGRGSFGNVTLCHYKGHKFALKVVHRSSAADVGERNLLEVSHPHLVRILHVAEVKNRIFISMEFAGHCNLQQLLDSKGYLDFKRRISFSHQVALGLSHCHKLWIVHRDVKPANVVVSPFGICKLGDFGHSLKVNRTFYTVPPRRVPSPKGTVSYTAPEVLRGFLPSFASDVYSLGVTLWQIQSREVPFAREHPHVVIYKVVSNNMRPRFKPADGDDDDVLQFMKITENCWDEDPEKRPAAQDVVQMLLNLLNC